jgi:hypothetical protein
MKVVISDRKMREVVTTDKKMSRVVKVGFAVRPRGS